MQACLLLPATAAAAPGLPPAQGQSAASLRFPELPLTTPTATEPALGRISFYGDPLHGRPTANGEAFDANALTMAHRTLPFGARVRITNLHNRRSVVVRVNDRGPFVRSRIADVSAAAARALGMTRTGLAAARIELIDAAERTRLE